MEDCVKTIHNPQFIIDDKNKRFSFFIKHHFGPLYLEYIQDNNINGLGFYGFGDALKDNHP
jgi:hypothetical protein